MKTMKEYEEMLEKDGVIRNVDESVVEYFGNKHYVATNDEVHFDIYADDDLFVKECLDSIYK